MRKEASLCLSDSKINSPRVKVSGEMFRILLSSVNIAKLIIDMSRQSVVGD